jgi:hypothetical protein
MDAFDSKGIVLTVAAPDGNVNITWLAGQWGLSPPQNVLGSCWVDRRLNPAKEDNVIRIAILSAAAALAAACSMTPTVTKERMTLGDVDMTNMECRRDTPPDSNVPRTICATPQAWAAFDENRRRETDAILAEGRKHANVGAFNRN